MHRGHRLQRDKRNGNYIVQLSREGKRRYFQLGPNKKEAEKRLAELEKMLLKGELTFVNVVGQVLSCDGKKDMKVETLSHHHLEWVSKHRAPGTYQNRQNYVIKFIDFIGSVSVSQLTRKNMEDFYAWAREHCSRGENGGNEALANVKAMLRWGVEMELVDLPFRRFPPLHRAQVITDIPTAEEWAKILEKADEDFGDMLLFGLLTGLRPYELRGLTKDMIRLSADGVICVEIQRHKTSRTVGTPKPRSVPLADMGLEIFNRQAKKHPLAHHVFLNTEGKPYTKFAFRDRLRRLCRRAGVSSFKPYTLRHTFATMKSDEGTESTALSRLMGHTTTRTLERYVHNNLPSHKLAMERHEERLKATVLKAG